LFHLTVGRAVRFRQRELEGTTKYGARPYETGRYARTNSSAGMECKVPRSSVQFLALRKWQLARQVAPERIGKQRQRSLIRMTLSCRVDAS